MTLEEFVKYHQTALEVEEIKYNGIIANLARPSARELRLWALGAPGACAIQLPGRDIFLGRLSRDECHRLANETSTLHFSGVTGADDMPKWFAERALQLGHKFHEPMQMQLHVLRTKPIYPGAPGYARRVFGEDSDLFVTWMLAFHDEAVPKDPRPSPDKLEKLISERYYAFWIVDGQPVSMAGLVRRTRSSGAIAGVYTPPSLRGRGYAGSVTASVVEQIFAEGKSAACLFTDVQNRFANRCYARIGFKPEYTASHFARKLPA